jgi:hypothetical protein
MKTISNLFTLTSLSLDSTYHEFEVGIKLPGPSSEKIFIVKSSLTCVKHKFLAGGIVSMYSRLI